jgi:hypothetical protein
VLPPNDCLPSTYLYCTGGGSIKRDTKRPSRTANAGSCGRARDALDALTTSFLVCAKATLIRSRLVSPPNEPTSPYANPPTTKALCPRSLAFLPNSFEAYTIPETPAVFSQPPQSSDPTPTTDATTPPSTNNARKSVRSSVAVVGR